MAEKIADKSSETMDRQAERVLSRVFEGLFVILVAVALYFTIALISYDANDSAWSTIGGDGSVQNAAGSSGAWFADVLFSLIGIAAFFLPLGLLYRIFLHFKKSTNNSF